MGKGATAVSLRPTGVEIRKPISKGPSFTVLEGVLKMRIGKGSQ